MNLQTTQNNKTLLKEAEKYFSATFIDSLNPSTKKESLVARFLICKFIEKIEQNVLKLEEKNNFINYTSGINGINIGKKIYYFSLSHKKDLVFIGVDDKKLGIDIEIIKERDENLLTKFEEKEYKILGGKNWNNFYILWTAKESIIKYLNINLDNIEEIILIKHEKISKNIGGKIFEDKMLFEYEKNTFISYTGLDGKKVFSVCIK